MSKILPDLTNMPPHIKQMIINDSDTATKLCQRELSRDFKCEVDKAPISYSSLEFTFHPEIVRISWTKTLEPLLNTVMFCATANGYLRRKNVDRYPAYEKEMEGDYRKAAVEKLLSVFKHSKVSVEELSFFVNREGNSQVIFDEFNRILSEKPFQLRVEKLTFYTKVTQQQILSVLRYLKPITLKELKLFGPLEIRVRLDVEEIVQTEQWMGLDRVPILEFEVAIPLEKFSHLNTAVIRLTTPPTETAVRILETFLFKPTLESLSLRWSGGPLDTTRAKEYLRQFEKIPERCSSRCDCLRLPNERANVVYIKISEYCIKIDRPSDENGL